MAARRSVDWTMILGPMAPKPAVVSSSAQAELGSILSACDELLTLDDPDLILRRAVEIARERIGLERVGLFLLDKSRQLMLGTWGTDLQGRIIDEHHVMYEVGQNDLDVFQRAAHENIPFTVIDNCPIVVHLEDETQVVGRGWVACTPIRSARSNIGMLFNDVGLSGQPVNELKQTRAVMLCWLLGTLLDPSLGHSGRALPEALSSIGHPTIVKVVRLLARDPSLTGKQLAAQLHISPSRLARIFKAETGLSLVDYRNRLRLERFQVLVDSGGENLLEAALAAGFGSYAQFHRVFRAVRGVAPSEHQRRRSEPQHSRPEADPPEKPQG